MNSKVKKGNKGFISNPNSKRFSCNANKILIDYLKKNSVIISRIIQKGLDEVDLKSIKPVKPSVSISGNLTREQREKWNKLPNKKLWVDRILFEWVIRK